MAIQINSEGVCGAQECMRIENRNAILLLCGYDDIRMALKAKWHSRAVSRARSPAAIHLGKKGFGSNDEWRIADR